MRAPVRFRPFLVIFSVCALGVVFALTAHSFAPLGIALLAALFALCAAFFVAFCVRRNMRRALTFAVAAAAAAAAVGIFFATLSSRTPLRENLSYTLSGRITEHFAHDGSELTVTLDDIAANGISEDGRITAHFTDAYGVLSYLSCGDRIVFSAVPSPNPLVDGMTVNAAAARSDVRYYAYADASDIFLTTDGEPSAPESARLHIRDSFVSFMGEDVGGIAYGMLVGDRYSISEEADDAYSDAGIGHVLSVSGLHISLAALLLDKAFGLLRMPGMASNILLTALLAFYTVFTGAAASAVRSLVMFAVSAWSRYFGPHDRLNALFAACTVCMLISPFCLFECGFLMSAGSVWGLIAFAPRLSEIFSRRLRLPRFLADGLGASAAVQVAIVPLTAVFFSEIGVYAVVVNALLAPVLSFVFVLLVVLLPLILIPPLGFVGLIPAAGVGWISALSAFVASLPAAVVVVRVSALAALVLPLSFIASRFVLTGGRAFRTLITVVLCSAVVMASRNGILSDNAVVFLGGSSAATVVLSDGIAALTADWSRGETVASAVSRSRLTNTVFDVYVLYLDFDSAMGIAEFARDYSVRRVVCIPSEDMSGTGVLTDSGIDVAEYTLSDPLDVAYIDGTPRGWVRNAGGRLCFFTAGTVYDEYLPLFDVVRGRAYYGSDPSVYAAFTRAVPSFSRGECVVIE